MLSFFKKQKLLQFLTEFLLQQKKLLQFLAKLVLYVDENEVNPLDA
jgi:hypothetical protein